MGFFLFCFFIKFMVSIYCSVWFGHFNLRRFGIWCLYGSAFGFAVFCSSSRRQSRPSRHFCIPSNVFHLCLCKGNLFVSSSNWISNWFVLPFLNEFSWTFTNSKLLHVSVWCTVWPLTSAFGSEPWYVNLWKKSTDIITITIKVLPMVVIHHLIITTSSPLLLLLLLLLLQLRRFFFHLFHRQQQPVQRRRRRRPCHPQRQWWSISWSMPCLK